MAPSAASPRRQHEAAEAGAEFLIASDEFGQFLDRLDQAWTDLRSCSVVAQELIAACKGYMPAAIMSRLQRAEPLAERVGYSLDTALIENWRRAFAELAAHNADVQLPVKNVI